MSARARLLGSSLLGSFLALALVAAPGLAADDAKPAKKAVKPKAQAATVEKIAKAPRARHRSPAPRTLREAMSRLSRIRVDVDFKEMPLGKVVEFISRVAGFNVIVAPQIQAKGIDQISPVTLKLRRATVKQLADLTARFSGTTLHLRDGILQFTTKEAARGKPVLRIYSIGDISIPLRNFPGPDLNLRPSGAEFEPEEESESPSPFGEADNIASMIQEMVEAESWESDKVSVTAHNHKLIVRQYPKVHAKILRFLGQLRGAR